MEEESIYAWELLMTGYSLLRFHLEICLTFTEDTPVSTEDLLDLFHSTIYRNSEPMLEATTWIMFSE